MATAPSGSAQALPLALLARALPRLSRHELEALTERLIDHLDGIDGDPDLEDDDPTGLCDEDGMNCGSANFIMHGVRYNGPGCGISDAY